MKKNYWFGAIIIVTGTLYSCGIRKDLNGTWVGVYGSVPHRPSYANHIPVPNDTNKITVRNDSIMPGNSRHYICEYPKVHDRISSKMFNLEWQELDVIFFCP